MKKTLSLSFAVIALLFAILAWRYASSPKDTGDTSKKAAMDTPFALETLSPASLEQRSAIDARDLPFPSTRPIPTNQWFSSLFFQMNGLPLYAYPWTVTFTDTGFQAGLPNIVASQNIVTGGAASDIVFRTARKHDGIKVEKWDDLSLLASASSNDEPLFSLRIMRGSPFLWLEANSLEAVFFHAGGVIAASQKAGTYSLEVGGKHFALYLDPSQFDVSLTSSTDLTLQPKVVGALVTLATLPMASDIDRFGALSHDPVIATEAKYASTATGYTVSYDLSTSSGGPTIFGLLPHHLSGQLQNNPERFGTLETIRGSQQFFKGDHFTIDETNATGRVGLDVAALSETDKDTLRALLKIDAAMLQFPEKDTYFAGKRLVAAAHLLTLAVALDEKEIASDIAAKLRLRFQAWRDGTLDIGTAEQHFSYDPVIHGVVGYPASFGSELFNDHHFHYGYFITAAAALGAYDPDFVTEYAPFINLLVMDVANLNRDSQDFPYLRNFDQYEGHSWAAGQTLFADGNNQESTSEAIQSWYGIAEWAKLIKNPELETTAEVLLTEETHTAWIYWLRPAWSEETKKTFNAPMVSLLWGGKAEYATWFSPLTEAKIGIELLPLGPQSGYLAQDPEYLKTVLAKSTLERGALFRDAFIMAIALVDRPKAIELLRTIESRDIDTWNTKSYLTAWTWSAHPEK